MSLLLNLIVELLHVLPEKRRFERAHLVHETSERPNVRFGVISLVPPDLRRRVVRRAGLSPQHPILSNFGDVEISDHRSAFIAREEYIRAFEVSVDDGLGMEVLEALEYVAHVDPDDFLLEVRLEGGELLDVLEQIASFRVVGDDAELLDGFVEEGLAVGWVSGAYG